jgi:hypothetical protein
LVAGLAPEQGGEGLFAVAAAAGAAVAAFVSGGVEELAGVAEVDLLDVQAGLVTRAGLDPLPGFALWSGFVVEARGAGGEAGG